MRNFPRRLIAHEVSPGILCRSCRQQQQQQRRQYASASMTAPPAPPASGIAALSSRRLISVAGPDAVKFLQGIVTANLLGPGGKPRQDGFYTGFLTATGRVLFDVMMYPNPSNVPGASGEGDSFLIEVDSDQAETLARHIKRYKLRAKLAVRLLPKDEATVWHAWNDDASQTNWDSIVARADVSMKDPRVPNLGFRLVQFGQKTPEIDLEQRTEDAYTIRRYLHGVAEGQDEISRETALPAESNMDFMNGIDFRKGCYVGQELTIRTKHRGVVRKRILPCMIYEKEHAMPPSLQYQPEAASLESTTASMIPRDTSIGRFEKRGRSAGKWLKGVGNIGLGLCRLEIMTDVVLPGETAAAAFKPEDEFLLEWGEEGSKTGVKVKAFVPDWLRAGLDASQH